MDIETFHFVENSTYVKIGYADKIAMWYFKDSDFHGAVEVIVKENYKKENEKISKYVKIWEGNDILSNATYLTFVKKFISEPDFREEFLVDGELWTGTVSFSDDSGVNVKCKSAINQLNAKKNAKFADFARLKTYGRDKFSSMKEVDLMDYISEGGREVIKEALLESELQLKALRWYARGLHPGKAVRKVKTDLEVTANIRK